MTPISAHHDHRISDYRFERQQSRAIRDLEWEDRKRVWRLWRGDVAVALAVILLGTLAFPVAEFLSAIFAK